MAKQSYINVRVDKPVREAITREASKEGITDSEWVRRQILKKLGLR